MIQIGYKLCSEEQSPHELVECAQRAEEIGFNFAMISDHCHPWIDRQGQSSFVWSVLGGISLVTEHLKIGTAVTCPTVRIHPAIIAQAAATAAVMLPGRFMVGLGSGEVKEQFDRAGGKGKPCYAEMTVCWAEDEKQARRTAYECWPIAGISGELTQVLPVPAHFEQAVKMLREEDVAEKIVCGPEPARYINQIREYEKAGFPNVFIHQIGADQAGFFRFCERELMPRLEQTATAKNREIPDYRNV